MLGQSGLKQSINIPHSAENSQDENPGWGFTIVDQIIADDVASQTGAQFLSVTAHPRGCGKKR